MTLQKLEGNRFALVPPRCARERDVDLEEVESMRAVGETDVARDELLFLVEDCRGFLEAYNLLAELALEENDLPLARAHYAFAYETALSVLPYRFQGRLPANEGYNPQFFLAGRGLARCLIAVGEIKQGREVLEQLAALDPEEPDVRALLEELDERQQGRELKPPGE